MKIEPTIDLLEEILEKWRETIGSDFEGYKNHVYRMVHFSLALKQCTKEERKKIIMQVLFMT